MALGDHPRSWFMLALERKAVLARCGTPSMNIHVWAAVNRFEQAAAQANAAAELSLCLLHLGRLKRLGL